MFLEELRNEVSLLQLVDQNIKRDIDDIKFDLKKLEMYHYKS